MRYSGAVPIVDENDATVEPASPSGSRPVWKTGVAAAFLIVALFALLTAVAPLSSTCRACHATRGERSSASTHRTIPCSACHARPGVEGWLEARAGEAGSMYPLALWSSDTTLPTHVDSSACTACHGVEITRIVTAKSVRMRHETCIARGVRCTDCHGTVGHGVGSARQVFPTMDSCNPCHDGTKAPSSCDTCHTGGDKVTFGGTSAWRVTHGRNWRSTHGMGSLSSCRLCHRPGYCAKCHYDQPHPDKWAGEHGAAAVATGGIKASCLSCHVKAFCDSCHGIPMPHPASWLKDHLTATKSKADPSCRRCHTEADCTTCHTVHLHPGRVNPGRRK
jgi:hypothetical protein